VSDELAAALAALAAESAAPAVTAAPFITAMQREAAARAAIRERRLRVVRWLAAIAGLVVALHLVATNWFFATPADEALAAAAQRAAGLVVPLYSSPDQPLQIAAVEPVVRELIDGSHRRYYAEVRLELRKSLYVPAVSNGTAAYRQLQESVEIARALETKSKFFASAGAAAPEAPALPQLLQLTHQAGEAVVVRVPFDADRFGWTWRIKPPQLENRTANRTLTGSSLDRYENTPYLIFGPQTMADIRARIKAARDYVIAVNRKAQRQADGVAVPEAPSVDPNALAQPMPAPVNPDAVALPDPDKPAVDPDAPAVRVDVGPRR